MAPSPPLLRRRQLLGLGCGAALLAGCRPTVGPSLGVVAEALPRAWSEALPAPWRLQTSADPAALRAALTALAGAGPSPELVALGDGWALADPPLAWQPLDVASLVAALDPCAAPVSRLFAPAGAPVRAFPWAYSPWVIALRSRPDLLARRREGWELLLDASLRGRLVLPSSPRVCIELMGADFERLQRLRRQALAYDDRDGLNQLLAGDAEAAVLPLQRLVPLLRRDQRLAVVWPASGAPLSWQLLLRPAGARQPLPLGWLQALLQPPLLPSVLAGGWVPPLPPARLASAVARFPRPVAALLAPDAALLERCWSLPPLSPSRRLALQTLWDAAAP